MSESHHFEFTYSDGDKVTVSLAFVNKSLALTVNPPTVSPEHEEEYLMWTRTILVDDILKVLPPEHYQMMADYGAALLKEKGK